MRALGVLSAVMFALDAACALILGAGGDHGSCLTLSLCAALMLACTVLFAVRAGEERARIAVETMYADLRQLACLLASDPRFSGCAPERLRLAESLRRVEGPLDVDGQIRVERAMAAFPSDDARRLVCVFQTFQAMLAAHPRDHARIHGMYLAAMADAWDGADPRGTDITLRGHAIRIPDDPISI